MRYDLCNLNLSGRIVRIWFRKLNPYGVAIKDIVEKWLGESQDFTAESLVKYINSKLPGCALTEKEFQEMDPGKKRMRS